MGSNDESRSDDGRVDYSDGIGAQGILELFADTNEVPWALALSPREHVARAREALGDDAYSSADNDDDLPAPAGVDRDEVLRILESFADQGLDPNPYPDRDLDWLAERIANAVGGSGGNVIYGLEQAFERSDAIGVVNPMCMLDVEDWGDKAHARPAAAHGYPWHVVADLAAAGVGLIRHVNNCDLAWCHLSHAETALDAYDPDEDSTIPPPDEMQDYLLEPDSDGDASFWRFRKFTLLCIVCALCEMKYVPIMLDDGSGWLSEDEEANVGDAKIGRPAHQSKFLRISDSGWEAFYYEDVGFQPGKGERLFQQLYFNVVVGEDASNYMKECARRKTLALAEYGKAVGALLFALDQAFHDLFGQGLESVVELLEVGNEMDSMWTEKGWSEEQNALAAQEVARMLLTVTAGVRLGYEAQAAGARSFPFSFRFPAFVGWVKSVNAPEELPQSQRDWQRRVDWMVKALDEGIGDELTRLKSFVVYGHIGMGTDEYEDWLETFGAAGLEWPEPWDDDALVDYQSSDFVAEIDFHFWHHCAGDGHGPRYADGHRMGEDIAVLRDGIDSLSESYPDLGWAMGGAAFLAEMPEGLEKVYYKGATPAYQAGMLVRRMLYAKAKGASRVLWHTFMARIVDMGANFGRQYDANGLRNDLYLQGSDYYPDSYKKLLFTNYAWRRPSWFSLRRLAWLLSRTRKLDFYYDSTNIVVILCEAKSNSGYRNPRALAGEKTTTYSRAWVAWMDQTASVDSVRLTFRGTSSDFTVLPLVPLVTLPSDDTSYDDDDYKASDANYPDFEEIEWTNKDHCSAAVSARTDSASLHYRYIDIDLEKASQGNPAPICVLTDADVELVDMERDPDTAPYEEGLAIRMYGPNLAAVGDVRDPLEVAPSQLATSTKAWWIP